MGSIVLIDWTKHRLDCRPEIGIFPVTRLDIEADLRLASFIIEADRIEADLNVTVAVTVTRGFETADTMKKSVERRYVNKKAFGQKPTTRFGIEIQTLTIWFLKDLKMTLTLMIILIL